ncbi:uncharacterized protein LOC124183682 isoform X2 [Neodiprion fabricii]|uniref:uncharacterized protein LOC124183682 isoform X2 n=1 Tax=Neodiprion fabricii TaxID=2872261 RepID=UPI001ED8C03C|nr:uncharacterized protein LOC124183682 isoform X2 [Neodiprion fabricii]
MAEARYAERPLSPVKKNKNGQEQKIKKLSRMTGFGRTSTKQIVLDYISTGRVLKSNFKEQTRGIEDKTNECDKNAIRRMIHDFYRNNEVPTVDKVLDAVNDDKDLQEFKQPSFCKLLQKLNFYSIKRRGISVLIENEDLIVWRRNYLRTITQYRMQGRSIYYLDEMLVKVGDVQNKFSINDTRSVILQHIGSAAGFVPGALSCTESKKYPDDYHGELYEHTFLNWFKRVLPLLDENCVIVMDNDPPHCIKQELLPDTLWTKGAIIGWLQSKGAVVDYTMAKAELLHIVELEKKKFNRYVIEELANKANKIVLRLPPYHCDINPIEMAWSMMKVYVKTVDTSVIFKDMKAFLEQGVAQITAQHWNNFVKHAINEENRLWEIDDIADRVHDKIPLFSTNVNAERDFWTEGSD